MALDVKVAQGRVTYQNRYTESILALISANGDDSEKIPLMIIGPELNFRLFKKNGNKWGLDYHAKEKAWMTQVLFYQCFKRV